MRDAAVAHRGQPVQHGGRRYRVRRWRVSARSAIPTTRLSFTRLAALSHWSPGALPEGVGQTLRETVFWTPPQLTAPDEQDHDQLLALSRLHLRFLRRRGRPRPRCKRGSTDTSRCMIAARILHPGHGRRAGARRVRAGRGRGALRGICLCAGRQLFDRHVGRLSAADRRRRFRIRSSCTCETPSPFTPLGAKGVGEGNCMSTPVCIANAVADALGRDRCRIAAGAGAACGDRSRRGAAATGTARSDEQSKGATAIARLRGEGEASVEAAAPSRSGRCCSIPRRCWP